MANQGKPQKSNVELEQQIKLLNGLLEEKQAFLQEAQDTLEAIRTGAVDSIVRSTPEGEQVFILKGSDQPYRNLIEEMNEGAILTSDDGTILYCNNGFALLVDTPLDKIMGTNISDWIPDSHVKFFKETVNSKNGRQIFDLAFQNKNQQLIPTQVSKSKISLDSFTASAFIITDLSKHMEEDVKKYTTNLEEEISQRKKAEQELKEAQVKLQEYTTNLEKLVEQRTKQLQERERLAAIGETAGMVGHDIRNPLQTIVSELFLANQAMKEVPEDRVKTDALESIANVQEQVDYINKIVSDLQDFAKPLKPELKEINLSEFVASFINTIKIPPNVTLKIRIQEDLKMKTDTVFLRRSITNLVNNAVQAMPNGGKLENNWPPERAACTCLCFRHWLGYS